MGKKILATVVVICIVAVASQAAAIKLCLDGSINLNLAVSGSALMGTAGPMGCDGQTVFAMGNFTRVNNGIHFGIYFDQFPTPGFCTEGWEIVGLYSGGVGTGTWYNTPDFPANGPFTITNGACSPLKADGPSGPVAGAPGVAQ